MAVKEAVELLKKGRYYAQRTKFREAFAYYNKALALDPKNPEGWYLRASVLVDTGKHEEALADCDRALALNQNYSDAYINRAVIYLNHGNKGLGCLDAQKACELGNCRILEMAKGRGDCR